MYATFSLSERQYSLITSGGKYEQCFRSLGNFMKPLLAWMVSRTHTLKRLRGARSAQHRHYWQRKWVDVLEGFVRAAALPSAPLKTRAHTCFLVPYVTCPQFVANQWALSPITPHNDPLFEPTDICGGGKNRALQVAAFLTSIINESCADMGVLGEMV